VPLRIPEYEPDGAGPPVWPYVAIFVALVVLGLAFGEMAREARREVPDGLDRQVITWVSQHRAEWPGLTILFQSLTSLGDPEVATPCTLLVAVVLIALGRRRIADLRQSEAFFWLAVVISSRFLCMLLKAWFQRERPPVGFRAIVIDDASLSFPSGHSVYAAVFFSMLAILIARLLPPSFVWLRFVTYAVCAVVAVLVGISRVWLTVHYPTDVIGGLLLGVAWVIMAYTLRYGWAHWRWHRQSGEA
jgi:undecaprenyl-diphosphatase